MSTNNTSKALQGWTPSPDHRGTLDILSACLATIFLSTWSAICLNVPDTSDTIWTHIGRKVWITSVSILGPEFLLGYALGEWQSARRSVADFKQLRKDDRWTSKHAFFADMGGFILRTKDDVRFFLDAKQILWLLKVQAMSTTVFEKSFLLDSKTIDDRNKSDISLRVIAVGQALWFCINVLARFVHGFSVTTLEITTIGIVVDSILVYYFWKDKPADVNSMEVVDIDITLNELILLGGDEAARTQPYLRTPLDFASRSIWSYNLIYHYVMNILKGMGPRAWRRIDEKSLMRRSENDILPVTGAALVIAWLSTAAFLGTNFIAWDFHFPTRIEKLLWRLSSCGLVVIVCICAAVAELLYSEHGIKTMQEKVQEYRKALKDSGVPARAKWMGRLVNQFRALAMNIRNNSPKNDPTMDVSLFFALVGVPMVAVYFLFRVYILVEDIIAFRALPADAYSTINWWAFVPHVG